MRFPARPVLLVALLVSSPPLARAQVRAARPIAVAPLEFAEPFSAINRMTELAGGNVLVYDATERKLSVADFRTGSLREAARSGGGPAEYRSVLALLSLPGDSVLLWDMGNQRTMLLSPDGSPVRTTPVVGAGDIAAMVANPVARATDARGNWYAHFQGVARGGREGDRADSAALVRVAPSMGRRDTLMMFPAPAVARMVTVDGSARMRAIGFPSRDAWGVFPDGRVLVIHGATYTPEVILPDGSRKRAAAIPFARIAITAKDREDHMRQQREQMDRGAAAMRAEAGPGGASRIELLEPEKWQSHKPALLGDLIRVDTRSRAWVRVIDRDLEAGERYDLLDRDGRLVDAVRMPKGVRLVGMGRGVLYGAREDEDGLVHLQRFALP
jgi:hypothetical protein